MGGETEVPGQEECGGVCTPHCLTYVIFSGKSKPTHSLGGRWGN